MAYSEIFRSMLFEVCENLELHITPLDDFSDALFRVSDQSTNTSFLTGFGSICSYPTNSASAYSIARDKTFTNNILSDQGICVPKGEHFFVTEKYSDFRPGGRNTPEALEYASKLGFPVFVKPNQGSHARFATIVHDVDELSKLLSLISESDYIAVIQEVCKGHVYRFFYAHGELYYYYRKVPQFVTGNGEDTIATLIQKLNVEMSRSGSTELDTSLKDFQQMMTASKHSYTDVLPSEAKLQVSRIASIAMGSDVVDYAEEAPKQVVEFLKRISDACGLNVIGVDVICNSPHDINSFVVIDVNANPEIIIPFRVNRPETAKAIWSAICQNFFS